MTYYLYEWHAGDFYIEDHELPYEETYCDTCMDCDVLIGTFKNEHGLRKQLDKEGVYPEAVEVIVKKWRNKHES